MAEIEPRYLTEKSKRILDKRLKEIEADEAKKNTVNEKVETSTQKEKIKNNRTS